MIDNIEINRSEIASHHSTQKAHNAELKDMIPGTQFQRTNLVGRVERWKVITGPYSELPTKVIKVEVMGVNDSKMHCYHALDLGLVPYEKSGLWNRLKVEIIPPKPNT